MNCSVICVSAPSGGGKTAIIRRMAQLVPNAVALYFDNYDDIADGSNIHPASLRQHISDGADYNAWQMPGLIRDLACLKRGESIQAVTEGRLLTPQPFIFLDAPFGRANDALRPYLDVTIYLDTPLDVAMARRIQRDYFADPHPDAKTTLRQIETMTTAYLDWGRTAYLEQNRQVKPSCDLVLDGILPIDELARKILAQVGTI